MSELPSHFGPYQIVSPLGAGGMGQVYRGRDTRLQRFVAIKILHDHAARDTDRQRRFAQEAVAASALNHPNILTVYDVGTDGDTQYLVSELIDGVSLNVEMNRGRLPLKRIIDITCQVAEGLAADLARPCQPPSRGRTLAAWLTRIPTASCGLTSSRSNSSIRSSRRPGRRVYWRSSSTRHREEVGAVVTRRTVSARPDTPGQSRASWAGACAGGGATGIRPRCSRPARHRPTRSRPTPCTSASRRTVAAIRSW